MGEHVTKEVSKTEAKAILSNLNWFEITARENFENILLPYAGLPNLTFLQIGAFTGDASLWLAQNVLTHPTSVLYDVDIWDTKQGLDHFTDYPMNLVEEIYNENIKPFPQIKKIKQHSQEFLLNTNVMFDFIYIDGGHTFNDIYYDGLFGYNKLKDMGIMVFDDWMWPDKNNMITVANAYIKLALQFNGTQRTIIKNSQRWIQKVESWTGMEWKK